jgi:hypothetical protein
MTPTTFLALMIVAGVAAIAAAMTHVARTGDTTVGPANTDTPAAPAAGPRGATPLAGRLADDLARARTGHSAHDGAAGGRAIEAARATGTARLARREQRLRALAGRRPLTATEADDLTAARTELAQRGRTVPAVHGVPRPAEEAQR